MRRHPDGPEAPAPGGPATFDHVVLATHSDQALELLGDPSMNMPGEPGSWMISIPQPPYLMVSVVVDYMKKVGVKTVGYIGYSDGWGDLVYGGLEKAAGGRTASRS